MKTNIVAPLMTRPKRPKRPTRNIGKFIAKAGPLKSNLCAQKGIFFVEFDVPIRVIFMSKLIRIGPPFNFEVLTASGETRPQCLKITKSHFTTLWAMFIWILASKSVKIYQKWHFPPFPSVDQMRHFELIFQLLRFKSSSIFQAVLEINFLRIVVVPQP